MWCGRQLGKKQDKKCLTVVARIFLTPRSVFDADSENEIFISIKGLEHLEKAEFRFKIFSVLYDFIL